MAEKDSGCCNIMMPRSTKTSKTNPMAHDVQKVTPGLTMQSTVNRTHAADGNVRGMKKG